MQGSSFRTPRSRPVWSHEEFTYSGASNRTPSLSHCRLGNESGVQPDQTSLAQLAGWCSDGFPSGQTAWWRKEAAFVPEASLRPIDRHDALLEERALPSHREYLRASKRSLPLDGGSSSPTHSPGICPPRFWSNALLPLWQGWSIDQFGDVLRGWFFRHPPRGPWPNWPVWQVSMGWAFIFCWKRKQNLQGERAHLCKKLQRQICPQNHHAEVPRHSWDISTTPRKAAERWAAHGQWTARVQKHSRMPAVAWISSTARCVVRHFLVQSWSADHHPRHEELGWDSAACQGYCKPGNDYSRCSLGQEQRLDDLYRCQLGKCSPFFKSNGNFDFGHHSQCDQRDCQGCHPWLEVSQISACLSQYTRCWSLCSRRRKRQVWLPEFDDFRTAV